MAQENLTTPRMRISARPSTAVPGLLLGVGMIARLLSARGKFLNADEAMHYLLAQQSSLSGAYHASLGTAHPPLLIIFLHYWGMIGRIEFFLRLPSVIAGTAAGWFLYAWLRDVSNQLTATIGLALFLFSPALIYTSAEVRQYALLLCFVTAALYFLERALARESVSLVLTSGAAIYLALLTHYSALIVALSMGVYGLLRIIGSRPGKAVISSWICVQAGGGAIAFFLWKTHISVIRQRPLTQDVAESYLRKSFFHAGAENLFVFFVHANLRLFHFLFSQGAVSIVGMLLFVVGIVALFRKKSSGGVAKVPTGKQLAWLLLLPFTINFATAVLGVYPYGGTRHNCYLAIFAMPAIAVAIAAWRPRPEWIRLLAVALVLALCNFAVLPAGAYIRPADQQKELMNGAIRYLRASANAGSTILTDYESGLLLSYYLCGRDITHPGTPSGSFYFSQCGNFNSASLLPRLWVFRGASFPAEAAELGNNVPGGQPIWLFQAGFIVDRETEFQSLLAQYGCPKPQKFGANILVCRISLQH
jgi:hypothetical protein